MQEERVHCAGYATLSVSSCADNIDEKIKVIEKTVVFNNLIVSFLKFIFDKINS